MSKVLFSLVVLLAAGCQAQVGGKPEEPCRVEGTVVNQLSGEPLKKVRLSLHSVEHPESGSLSTTSAWDGKFSFSNVAADRYTLTADRTGFASQTYSARPQGSILALQPAQTVRDVNFKLTPHAVVSGIVVDEDGDPLSGVSVQVLRHVYLGGRRQLLPMSQGRTNDLGEYRIAELPPGDYYLQAKRQLSGADADEWSGTVYYPNVDAPAAAAPLQVPAGAKIRGIDFLIRHTPAVRISGRVMLGSRPARNGMVMLMPKDPAVWGLDGQPEQVREGGRFELRGVSPGSYILSVEQFGETGNQRLSARLPIEVRDGNIDGIEMALSPGVEVTGQVGYEGGAPNTKVGSNESNTPPKVILEPRNQTLTLGVTGGLIEENGRFKLTGVGPDIYGVDIAGLPPDSYIKTVRLGSTEITGTGLDFNQGGASGELSIVVSNSGGQIEGTVEQGENQRVAGIQVVAVPEGAKREQMRLFKLSSTAENGHFELKGLAPGEYLLFAFERIEPGAYRDPAFLKPLEDKGSRVAIEEKSRKSVVLKAIPAGTSSTVR